MKTAFCDTLHALEGAHGNRIFPPDMSSNDSLRDHVIASLRRYFQDMGGTEPENLYRYFLSQIEPPLIEETLKHTGGNQSRAARILGITRNTLRSKVNCYDIDVE